MFEHAVRLKRFGAVAIKPKPDADHLAMMRVISERSECVGDMKNDILRQAIDASFDGTIKTGRLLACEWSIAVGGRHVSENARETDISK